MTYVVTSWPAARASISRPGRGHHNHPRRPRDEPLCGASVGPPATAVRVRGSLWADKVCVMESEPEDLLAFYRRYLKRCNEHRFDELGEFVADDVNGPTEGLRRYSDGLRAVVEAFPDYQWELQRLLVDDQWMAARLYGTGTQTGPFRGIAATGRIIRTQELVIYRTVGGKIAECWGDLGSTVRDELTSGTTGA